MRKILRRSVVVLRVFSRSMKIYLVLSFRERC